MKKLLLSSLLYVIFSGMLSCTREKQSMNQEKVQAAVDKIRSDLMDTLGICVPSLNVLIQTPAEQIFVSSAAGCGEPVTSETYFRFASNTKNFTAAAILNMFEDGWLDYKAKITGLIPGSNIPYTPNTADWDFPYRNDITIEQLLQHSAGVRDVDNDSLPGYNGLSYTEFTQQNDPTHQFTTTEMVKVLKDKHLFYFPPGTAHHYSNTGYSILAEIIQRVYSFRAGTSKTYADYMYDYVVGPKAPVPLNRVRFPILATDVSMPVPQATGTEITNTATVKYNQFNMSGQLGEGNGYGTMTDLNTYIRTQMKGQNILDAATVQLMQKNFSPGDTRYALGCTFTKNLGYGHNGARIGYISVMAYDPLYDVSVVAMIPLWDLRNGNKSFEKCFMAMYDAAYAARRSLGFPGKP